MSEMTLDQAQEQMRNCVRSPFVPKLRDIGNWASAIESAQAKLTELRAECHKLSANLADYVSALNSAESERDELRAIVARVREPVSDVAIEQFKKVFADHSTLSPRYDGCIDASLNAYRKRILGETE